MTGFDAPDYLKKIIRIIPGSGLRIYKKLAVMSSIQVDVEIAMLWIPVLRTSNRVGESPLTPVAIEAQRDQMAIVGKGPWPFADKSESG